MKTTIKTALLAIAIMLTSCATIITGTKQKGTTYTCNQLTFKETKVANTKKLMAISKKTMWRLL